ncbi:ER lumen protein retaining receptor-domain-containing protein [Xylariaceae sp. FL0662B]|nr:ER lumen protein retaining receptor-domain-containing protein [Xylariaceae sp. FL0662B]
MTAWNVFRVLGDCSHLLSKCILIFAIHRNRSAEGVSMITQVLYAVVFCSRYTDFFQETSTWNYFFKLFYIISSIYIIAIMRWMYPRTREREVAWKLGGVILVGSLLVSPFTMLIFESKARWSFFTWLWDFSQILESVCVLPQLLLLRQTTVPTVIDSFYLLALGSYRALYMLNWIWREFDVNDRPPNAVSVIFGIVQTALYVDFFWVYYTRQRVKLRGGGVVDADDIRRGWLLNRIFGKRFDAEEQDDEEGAPALGRNGSNGNAASSRQQRRSKWGARGISISADDGVREHEARHADDDHDDHDHEFNEPAADPDAKMRDPDELARALDDDDDDDEDGLPSASSHADSSTKTSAGANNNGNVWRD